MPSIPPSMVATGRTAAGTSAGTPGTQRFSLSFGQTAPPQALPPGADDELQQYLTRVMTPAPQGVQGDIGNGMTLTPPATPQEQQERKAGWRALFDKLASDPNAQQALLIAAAQILQPIEEGSGETALSRLVQGATSGSLAYGQLSGEQEERDLRTRALESEIETREAALDLQDRQQAALTRLGEQVQSSETYSEDEKARITTLLEAGETTAALKLMLPDKDVAKVLTPAEIAEQFPSLPEGSIVAIKGNGLPTIIHVPEGVPNEEQIAQTAGIFMETARNAGREMDPALARLEAAKFHTKLTGFDFAEDGTATKWDWAESVVGLGTGAHFVPSQVDVDKREEEDVVAPLEGLAVRAAEHGTGVPSFFNVIKGSIPFLGTTPSEEESIRGQQRLKQFSNRLIRARSINPRNPVAEIERIKKEGGLDPKLLDNPDRLRTAMEALDETLEIEIRQLERDLKDGIFDGQQRADARQSLREMKSAREFMWIKTRDELVSKLTSADAVSSLSDDQVWALALASDEDQYNQMPTEVLQALKERLQSISGR